jgi:hypothetical protein
MDGTCDNCIKQTMMCMVWVGKDGRIAASCSRCRGSKKKCTFKGVPSSDFNKRAHQLPKSVGSRAMSTTATRRAVSRAAARAQSLGKSHICIIPWCA